MKKRTAKTIISVMLVCAIAMVVAQIVTINHYKQEVDTLTQTNTVLTAQVQEYQSKQSIYDTASIEAWCGDGSNGTVSMIGCVYYDNHTVMDELGYLWYVEEEVNDNEFYLMWIADNHTPDVVEDDVVIKLWQEVHE